MSSIEKTLRLSLVGLGLMTSCSSSPPPAWVPPDAPAPADQQRGAATEPEHRAAVAAEGPGQRPSSNEAVVLPLPPPGPVRSWAELRLQAANRLMQANPGRTYEGPVVEPLLGIPVLEIELNADGSIRRILVLRQPQEARDTTRLAEEAVRRAAPFGNVSHLPRPWRFTETFLFNDQRRFKPRTLDR